MILLKKLMSFLSEACINRNVRVILPLKLVIDEFVDGFDVGEIERTTRNGDGRGQLFNKRI
jgi:hypothetical protein